MTRLHVDACLPGFFIPSNLRMQISITAIHRDPRNYKDPAKFDPDRWQVKVSSWHVAFAFALESIIHSRFLHSGQEESYKYLFPSCCRFLTGRKTSRKGTDLLSVWVRPPDMHRNGAGSVGDCVVPSSSCLQIHVSDQDCPDPRWYAPAEGGWDSLTSGRVHALADGKHQSLRRQPFSLFQGTPTGSLFDSVAALQADNGEDTSVHNNRESAAAKLA